MDKNESPLGLYMRFITLTDDNKEEFLRLISHYNPQIYTAARMTHFEKKCFCHDEIPEKW